MIKEIEIVVAPEDLNNEIIVKQLILDHLHIKASELNEYSVLKRSIDARSKKVVFRLKVQIATQNDRIESKILHFIYADVHNQKEVYIIGAGPAGIFAALRLIELNYKPIVIERGKDVKDRRRDLAALNKELVLNPESNYCFGEGGAGTYSDGKLYTRSTKRGDIDRILQRFIEHGANPDIAINTRPHIGTNKLPQIIQSLREKIIECGGEFHFNTKLTDIEIQSNKIKSITLNDNIKINTDKLILATGHSARDIYELLHRKNILIEAKPFALGVRIEHPQSIIDQLQYKCETRPNELPPAYYNIVEQVNGKGVFSFCMCPGGIIAPCATNHNEVVVNGWSPSKRNNHFANSGLVVQIDLSDIPDAANNPLAALNYQHAVEQLAYQHANNSIKAPAQRIVDFVNQKVSSDLPENSYLPGLTSANLHEVLPLHVSSRLKQALPVFGKKMKGYFSNEGILVGVESRTSSAVRIPRDRETFEHIQIKGLYPCAEGAGYAGGIVSAAIDGERCAEALALPRV
jgi:uncharacterized FAD-dependent dehydrogenase